MNPRAKWVITIRLLGYFTSKALNTRQVNFKAKYSTPVPVRTRTIDFTLVLCIANYCIL